VTQHPRRNAFTFENLPAWAWRNRPELWLLGGVFLAGLLLLAFGHIAEEVLEGDATRFDQTVLLALRNPADPADPLGPAWLEEAARDITSLGSYAVLGIVFFAVIAYLLMTQRRMAALWVTASVGGGVLLSNVLKYSFDRPRPELVAHAARVFTSSFPSGHATAAAAYFGALIYVAGALRPSARALVRTLAGLAIVLVALSRVMLRAHWPSDVLGGIALGLALASAAALLARPARPAGA